MAERAIDFAMPTPADYQALFGTPIYSEALRIDGVPHAMAMLVRKPDGRVFAWMSFRHDIELERDAHVGKAVLIALKRALRAFRASYPREPVYSGADERGYPQVVRMLQALRFEPTDERQRENQNRIWVWRP